MNNYVFQKFDHLLLWGDDSGMYFIQTKSDLVPTKIKMKTIKNILYKSNIT